MEGRCTKCRGDRPPALKGPEMSSELLGKSIVCIYLYFHHPFPLQEYLSHFQKTVHPPCLPHLLLLLGSSPGPGGVGGRGAHASLSPFCRSPVRVLSLWGWIKGELALLNVGLF